MRLLCIIALLVSAGGALFLAWFGWSKRRSVPSALAFAGLLLTVALYAGGYALELSGNTVAEMLDGSRIEYLGIPFLPAFWFLLSYRFNYPSRPVPRSFMAVLLTISFLTLVIFQTNGAHHLHYRSVAVDMNGPFPVLSFTRGAWYWFHVLYSNTAILAGNAMFLLMLIRSPGHCRTRTALMLAGSVLPWSAFIVHLAGVAPWGGDPVPFALAFSCALYALGLFRYRIFDLAPLARSLLVENLGDAVMTFNNKWILADFNRAALSLMARGPRDAAGAPVELLLDGCRGLLSAVKAGGGLVDEPLQGQTGRRIVAQVTVTRLQLGAGREDGHLVLIHDISELKKAEEALRDSEEKFRLLFDAAPEPILLLDGSNRIVDCNHAAIRLLGDGCREKTLYRQPTDFSPFHQPDGRISAEISANIMRTVFSEGRADFEWELLGPGGASVIVDVSITVVSIKGKKLQLVHLRDITEKKLTEKKLRELSLIDELTGLYNRRGFLALSVQQIKVADRLGKGVMLFYVDMDNMKAINDTFGHSRGDQALKDTAQILKASFRVSDIVARLGGDEFVGFALESGDDPGESVSMRIEENLRLFNMRADHPYKLSLSMGTARYDVRQPETIEQLMEEADRDMYRRKHEKKMKNAPDGFLRTA
jgi:diguanylate cyclase (GGDEF)-like protein/PAS domain S-box-containing protein